MDNNIIVKDKPFTFNPYNGKIGLNNLGNTCYLNSVLQNLKNIYLLTKLILIDENNINIKNDGLSYYYRILLANLINQDSFSKIYDPYIFYKILNKKEPFFAFNKQNDSASFLIIFLNYLVNEIKIKTVNYGVDYIKLKSNNKEEKDRLKKFLNNFFISNNSPIIDIFYGFLESIFRCNNKRCGYIKYNFQSFNVLNLPIIYDKNRINCLEDAIKLYQKERAHKNEKNIYCPYCKQDDIINQRKIIALPKILIINLIRVGNQTFHRFDLKIPYKLEMKNLIDNINYNQNNYEIIGFIKHYGGPNSGHNISICKNFFDEKWYSYNDDSVNPLNVKDYSKLDTSNSFLYFYKLIEKEKINNEDLFIIEKKSKNIRNSFIKKKYI